MMSSSLRCLGCLLVPLGVILLLLVGLIGALIAHFAPSSNGGGGNERIVQNALAMAAHLHNCPPDNLDQCWDAGFPSAALAYWARECPGCAAASNGNLQCVMFDVAAYGLAGIDLPVVSNAVDFWANYQAPSLRAKGWEEIPNGAGMPAPGDMVIMSSPYFGGVGHMTIITAVTPPTNGRAGSLTFAQANGPGATNTFPLPSDLRLSTWTKYTVLGFIRYAPAFQQGTPRGLPNSPYVSLAWNDAIQAGISPTIFVKQINQESGFNPNAKSPAGAEGIAQFMPSTAAGLDIDPWNPTQALQAAARMMASEVRHYGSDYQKALAAYNAGSGAVQNAINACGANWLTCLPTETQHYVSAILS
ncbi:MAG TPA: lytic transglycosylase domain-containing protein [Ktedonobacteraceae bacterium]|nr:lytic transglycosylase domain-containing protein [Ktedonobacteraceae bacterium]